MYNYQAPSQYGQPPSYGGFTGQPPAASPGFGAPGMGPPPGFSGAPGMQPGPSPQQGNFPSSFQPPPNMPNINFSAPVIRLGTTGPGKPDTPSGGGSGRRDTNSESMGNRRGTGLGFDGRDREQQRNQMRDSMMNLQPPSREEIARTIFVGNITESCGGDEGFQRILGVAGGLRRWIRATDSDNKPCSFGFAEYEDADSLGTAIEILKDAEIPTKKSMLNGNKDGDDKSEKTKLLVIVDENSQKYMDDWRSRGSMNNPEEAQFRLDSAREELQGVLASFSATSLTEQRGDAPIDPDGDTAMQNGDSKVDAVTGEVVTIPLTADDELSDIPAEMRETVAKEITAFRDRSIKRDLERLRREEDLEQAERLRASNAARTNRLASPPPTTPIGSTGGANGIPVGPRDRGISGAPLGPKGFQGAQIPRDYQKGVSFINGGNRSAFALTQDEEESDASDGEIEARRKGKENAELEKLYLDQERRWLNRERSRTAAVEREKQRDKEESANTAKEKAAVAGRLRAWSDDVEATRKVEEYYHDRSQWLRNRAAFRAGESEQDDWDRATEDREKAREQERRNRDLGMADQFLAQQAEEMESRVQAQPQRFKMSLGAAAQRAQQAAAPRRTMAEVEGLLEDEEDGDATTTKRTLVPITIDSSNAGSGLSEEERTEAVRQLAKEIPSDKEGLWNWPIKWDFVDDSTISEQLRPFVERKIVEYLGVQEQMLVDVVEDSIKKKGSPQGLVGELEGALDEEAEVLVKKLWRMLIFFSESEKRGLSV